LGDPTSRTVEVYLPEGYDEASAAWPLFVALAGFTGSGLGLSGWKAFTETLPQRLDRLIASGEMGPVVLAMPDCFTSLGGNQYIDSAAMGRWEGFVLHDMVPALEARYRVVPGPSGRAVFGKSSGGYGAIAHGLLHGDQWAAVACHSGDMGFDIVYRRELHTAQDALARFGGDPLAFVRHFHGALKVRGSDLHHLMTLAMAATYAPDPDAPLGIRLPIDPYTGALDEAQWARWLAHDPIAMIERPECQESLAKLRGVFIDCGSRDQYLIHYGSRAFSRRLGELGISHVYEEFDDDHSGVSYRMDRSLPFLDRAIRA
jgi:S-formylglutathione hydrolase FrmB